MNGNTLPTWNSTLTQHSRRHPVSPQFNQCILNLVVDAAHVISAVVKQHPSTEGKFTVQSCHNNGHVEVR